MGILIQTMVPVFGLIALGYGSARAGIVDEAGVRGLVLFVFTFAIPALLLRSVADLEIPADAEWGFLLAFYVGSFATWALGMGLAAFVFRRPLAEQAVWGLGAAFSNLVLIGLPFVLTALGPEASFPMLLIIGFHSATFMPISVLLVQAGDPAGAGDGATARLRTVLGEVARNPIIVALALGVGVRVSGLPLEPPIRTILDLLGAASIPCALFALGGSLAAYPIAGGAGPAVVLTVLKLVVHPLAVWVVAVPVLGLDGLSVTVAVLLAAMPSAVFVYLFGARYRQAAQVAARTVFLTSVASFATLWIVLLLVRP